MNHADAPQTIRDLQVAHRIDSHSGRGQSRGDRRSAVARTTAIAFSGHGSDNPTCGDLSNAVVALICDIEVAGTVHGYTSRVVQLSAGCRPSVAGKPPQTGRSAACDRANDPTGGDFRRVTLPYQWKGDHAGRSTARHLVSGSSLHHEAIARRHHAVFIHLQLPVSGQTHFEPLERPGRGTVHDLAVAAEHAAVARVMQARIVLEV